LISVTLDSNIYISALIFGGEPLRVLKMAEDGLIRLDVSDAIFEEFSRVLRDKFDWGDKDIAEAQHDIRSFANYVAPVEALTVVRDDADDNRIIECAAAARSDYIVTGDKHLLRLGNFVNIRIVNPGDFLTEGKSRGDRER
jgi:uncharacterized protein